jgi:hypothetical protein
MAVAILSGSQDCFDKVLQGLDMEQGLVDITMRPTRNLLVLTMSTWHMSDAYVDLLQDERETFQTKKERLLAKLAKEEAKLKVAKKVRCLLWQGFLLQAVIWEISDIASWYMTSTV